MKLVLIFVLIFCVCFTAVVGVTWLAIAFNLLPGIKWPWQR